MAPGLIAAGLPRLRRVGGPGAIAAVLLLAGLALALQGLWIPAKARLAQYLLEEAFGRSLATGAVVKPWPWFDTWPVARIEIPRLGLSSIALADATGQALAFGPGHVAGTPAAGEAGTAVFAAHRDTHFAGLKDILAGDEIRVTRRDGRLVVYRVAATSVVLWNASGIDAFAAGHNLVLATCWPFGALTGGPHRFLVHATMMAP